MKKIALVTLGILLVTALNGVAAPTAADEKWLAAVQKMVESGKNKVSTSNQERVELLKKWAGKQGMTVNVAKTEAGFQLELTRTIAKN
ncbi:MAG: hypothetical protein U1F65_10885 [Verrucomicrobiota bacterium]